MNAYKNLAISGETQYTIDAKAFNYLCVKNNTSGNVVVAFTSGKSSTDEDAWLIKSGEVEIVTIPNDATKAYINGTGNVQTYLASAQGECPFKSASAGGSGGSVTYTATLTDGKECGKLEVGEDVYSIYSKDYDSDISLMNSRLDTAISAVTTDTEVTDIRVGADGTTYATAGDAVRGQVDGIKGDIVNKTNPIYNTNNIFKDYKLNETARSFINNQRYGTEFINITPTKYVEPLCNRFKFTTNSSCGFKFAIPMDFFDVGDGDYVFRLKIKGSNYKKTMYMQVFAYPNQADSGGTLLASSGNINTCLDSGIYENKRIEFTITEGVANFNHITIMLYWIASDCEVDFTEPIVVKKGNDEHYSYLDSRIDGAINNSFNTNLLSAFKNIFCAGDSLTWGAVYTSLTEFREAKNPYNKVLGVRTGATVYRDAQPGIDSINYYASKRSSIIQKENQLIIIYLGTNGGLTDTIDTDASGSDASAYNISTQTGAYCALVKYCIDLGAKVLLVKLYTTSGSMGVDVTNNVIDKIAEKFKVACIENKSLGTKYHKYPNGSGYDSAHYNDFGYVAFADYLIHQVENLDEIMLTRLIPN